MDLSLRWMCIFLIAFPFCSSAQNAGEQDEAVPFLDAVAVEGIYANHLSSCPLPAHVSSYADVLMARYSRALLMIYDRPRSEFDEILVSAKKQAAVERLADSNTDWCDAKLSACLLTFLSSRDGAASRFLGPLSAEKPANWPEDVDCSKFDSASGSR